MKARQDAHETQTGQTLAEVIREAREWLKAEAGATVADGDALPAGKLR